MNAVKERILKVDRNTMTLFIIGIFIFVGMSILDPASFLGATNIQGMCIQFSEFGILALGMMICMISGGIDLSLVGIANFSSIVAALVMIRLGGGAPTIALAFVIALAIGALCGLFNGFLIGVLEIPPMLVTLCGLQLYTGLGLAITKGPALTGLPSSFSFIANGTIGPIPVAVLVFAAACIIMGYILRNTVYGQYVLFLGSNSVASKYSGINNLKTILTTYMISGILGGAGGLLISSHYNSAKADYGSSYTLLTLLIVVLGGTAPEGGRGKVSSVVLAIVVLQLVSSAFNLLRVNAFIKTFVWGIILLLAMVINHVSLKKKAA